MFTKREGARSYIRLEERVFPFSFRISFHFCISVFGRGWNRKEGKEKEGEKKRDGRTEGNVTEREGKIEKERNIMEREGGRENGEGLILNQEGTFLFWCGRPN